MGGGELEGHKDEKQQSDDEERVDYSKLLEWLKSNSLESCFTYFVTNGLKDYPPGCRALFFLHEDSEFLKNVKYEHRKRLQRLVLDKSSFWKLVPNEHRWRVFQTFARHNIIDEDDIAELDQGDLKEVLHGLDGDVTAKIEEIMTFLRGGAVVYTTQQVSGDANGMSSSDLKNAKVDAEHSRKACSAATIEKAPTPATVVSEKNIKADKLSDTFWDIVAALGPHREVYRLMELCVDCQNGSSVDKFVLPRAEVARFGNAASQNSVSSTASKFDFLKLDNTTQTCYGVFGQRRSSLLFLQKLGFAKDKTDFKNGITMDEPGLYAYVASPLPQDVDPYVQVQADSKQVPKRTVFLVVWPEDDAFEGIRAKSKTTTFLRYLTQLCSKIFVCLDEVSAKSFPMERKPRKLESWHDYDILREVVQEERFDLLTGISAPYKANAKAVEVERLVESTGGAAVLFGRLCSLQVQFMPYLGNISLKQASDELQRLLQHHNVELKMNQEDEIIFFQNFSQKCKTTVLQVEEHRCSINTAKDESACEGLRRIESNKLYKKSLESLMHEELQRLISPRWLELSRALTMDNGVEMDPECLKEGVQNEVRLSVKHWGILENTAFCCAIFLQPGGPEIKLSAVEKCFDHVSNPKTIHETFASLANSLYIFFKVKGHNPELVKECVKQLMESSDWTDFLLKDVDKSSKLLAELKRCMVKRVKSRVESLITNGPLSTTERKQALKAQLDWEAEEKCRRVVSDALKELRELAFPCPGDEVQTNLA